MFLSTATRYLEVLGHTRSTRYFGKLPNNHNRLGIILCTIGIPRGLFFGLNLDAPLPISSYDVYLTSDQDHEISNSLKEVVVF